MRRNWGTEHQEKVGLRTSLAVQWVTLCLPVKGMQVRSLGGELRSHMTHSQKRERERESNINNRSDIVLH